MKTQKLRTQMCTHNKFHCVCHAPNNFSETTENYFQIFVVRDRIQFAHKQHIFRRSNVRVRYVTYDLQYCGSGFRFLVFLQFNDLFRGHPHGVIERLVCSDSIALKYKMR